MKDLTPGDIVIIQPPGPIGFPIDVETMGTLISIKQSYWDLGEGDCGYVDVAEILTEGKIEIVACSYLVPLR